MNNNIILELRQEDSGSVVSNGDWTTLLAKDVIIENGDTIALKQAWIDSRGESNIFIPDDLTLSVTSGIYFTDWFNPNDTIPGNSVSATTVKRVYYGVDGTLHNYVQPARKFIPYDSVGGDPLVGYDIVYAYTYSLINDSNPSLPFTAEYTYTDVNNNEIIFRHPVPANTNDTFDDTFGVIAKHGTFHSSGPPIAQYNVEAVGEKIHENPVITTYTPQTFQYQFILPKGSYDPNDLSLLLSEKLSLQNNNMSLVGPNYGPNVINSTFLKSSNDFCNSTDTNNADFFDDGLTMTMTFKWSNDAHDIFVGSSQNSLEYNATTQRFNFTYLHTPMYDDATGSNICVRYQYISTTYDEIYGNTYAISSNGGIYFTDLSAVDSKGVTVDFWSGLLGFDLNSLLVKSTLSDLNFDSFGKIGYFYKLSPLTRGVNITDGYYGLDSCVIKGADTWYHPPQKPYNVCSTIQDTYFINATRTLPELVNTCSHYVLDCNFQFKNNYIGVNMFNNVQGLVSKYYSFGQYTYGVDDGSITYQHKGATIMLKSVGIRILKSDKTKDNNIGSDNTIIFQLIKASSLRKN